MVVWYATLDVAAQATRAPQYALADPISKYAPFSSSDAEIDWPHTQEDVSHDETPTQVRDEGVPQKVELGASNPKTQERHSENGSPSGPQRTNTNTPKPREDSGAVHKDHTSVSARKASGTKDSGTETPIPSEDFEVELGVWQK